MTTLQAIWDPVMGGTGGGSVSQPAYYQKLEAVAGASLIAYWRMGEAAGPTIADSSGAGRDGTITNGIFAQTGMGDGNTGVLFDGTTAYGNLYSAGLAGAFISGEFSISLWAKVSPASFWIDGNYHCLISLAATWDNSVQITKANTDNTIEFDYLGQGTASSGSNTAMSGTDWFHVALTISKSNNRMRCYINGSQWGADIAVPGVWIGALNSLRCGIGSVLGSSANAPWGGSIAHVAIWSKELTRFQVGQLGSLGYNTFALTAIGDSKTASGGWIPDLINDLFLNKSIRLLELPARIGIGGIRINGMRLRVDADISAMNNAPKNIMINLGANDVLAGDFNATQCKTDLDYIVSAYHSNFPAANIRIAKIWVRSGGSNLTALNTKITELYSSYGWLATGIDETTFLPGSDDGATTTSDGVHLNAAGDALESAAWKAALGY